MRCSRRLNRDSILDEGLGGGGLGGVPCSRGHKAQRARRSRVACRHSEVALSPPVCGTSASTAVATTSPCGRRCRRRPAWGAAVRR
jgi:hypothetical protein